MFFSAVSGTSNPNHSYDNTLRKHSSLPSLRGGGKQLETDDDDSESSQANDTWVTLARAKDRVEEMQKQSRAQIEVFCY